MVAGPESDALQGNPIKLMTREEIRTYNRNFTYCFHREPDEVVVKDEEGVIEEEFESMNEDFCDAGLEVGRMVEQGGREEWDEHTDILHDYFRNNNILQHLFICKNKAYLKLQEIFKSFPIRKDPFYPREFRSFHLCEGPGYFIEATLIHILQRQFCPLDKWSWGANTLNPYFENIDASQKLVDDSHIKPYPECWYFGPKNDGNVADLCEDYLIANGLAGNFDFVTADGSTYTEGNEERLEEIVHPIIEAEVKAALMLLRTGGRFILKIYRMNYARTRDVLKLLGENFTKIWAFKPMTSRPGSSEKYLICDGFGQGECPMRPALMVECDRQFLDNQTTRMQFHATSFINDERPFEKEHRRVFIQEMRSRTFNSLYSRYRDYALSMFPRNQPSPWAKLYGHNLARRFTENVETAIDDYLNNAPISNTISNGMNWEIINRHLNETMYFETSEVGLKVKDSLFIDPVVLVALDLFYEHETFDLFELTYRVRHDPENLWRNYCPEIPSIENGGKMVLIMHPFINLESIIDALILGHDMNMTSFEFRAVDSEAHKKPLILSRLSASVFILCSMFFEKSTMINCNVKFENLRHEGCGRARAAALRDVLAQMPNGTGIRTFVPIPVLEMFHSTLTHVNMCMLMALRSIKREPPEAREEAAN